MSGKTLRCQISNLLSHDQLGLLHSLANGVRSLCSIRATEIFYTQLSPKEQSSSTSSIMSLARLPFASRMHMGSVGIVRSSRYLPQSYHSFVRSGHRGFSPVLQFGKDILMFQHCKAPHITTDTIIEPSLNQNIRYIQCYLPGSSSRHEHQRIQKPLQPHTHSFRYYRLLIQKHHTSPPTPPRPIPLLHQPHECER